MTSLVLMILVDDFARSLGEDYQLETTAKASVPYGLLRPHTSSSWHLFADPDRSRARGFGAATTHPRALKASKCHMFDAMLDF